MECRDDEVLLKCSDCQNCAPFGGYCNEWHSPEVQDYVQTLDVPVSEVSAENCPGFTVIDGGKW